MLTVAAQQVNLAVRFGVELALLSAVGSAVWQLIGAGVPAGLGAAAAVLVSAAGWVLVVHGTGVPASVRVAGQLLALGLGVVCLLWMDAPQAAGTLFVVAVINAALLAAWNQ